MITSNVKFEVSVCCMTYNQKDYIEDTMRGFTMQQTTFPYLCIVMDDASTDGEQDLIKKYLEQHFDDNGKNFFLQEETDDYTAVLRRHKTNVNCFFAVYFLKYNHYQLNLNLKKRKYYSGLIESVEYTGYCEGDDYWISPFFLQMSVDFLKDHNDYSAVFGNKLVSDEKGNVIKKIVFKNGLTIHDIMRGSNMGLRSLFFRKQCLFVSPFETSYRDLHIYYKCAVSGKMKYIDCDFAVYRLTGKGEYSSLQERDVVYTSYLHYYEFHKKTNFIYQKDYVNYQIRKLMEYLSNQSMFSYCCQLIRQFHVPSKKRFLWYMQYGILMLGIRLFSILKTTKNIA